MCSDLDLTNACSITRAPQCKCVCDFASRSYWIQEVCRVPAALGEAQKTLGKGFAECYTRQTLYRQTLVCRVFFVGHSAKTLPSVQKTLGKLFFKNKNKKRHADTTPTPPAPPPPPPSMPPPPSTPRVNASTQSDQVCRGTNRGGDDFTPRDSASPGRPPAPRRRRAQP